MTNTERSSMVRMNVYDDLLATIRKNMKDQNSKLDVDILKDFEQIVKHLRGLASIYKKFMDTDPEETYALYEMAAMTTITTQASILTQDNGELKEIVLAACNFHMTKKIKSQFGIDLFPQPTDDEASNGKGLDILAEEGLL